LNATRLEMSRWKLIEQLGRRPALRVLCMSLAIALRVSCPCALTGPRSRTRVCSAHFPWPGCLHATLPTSPFSLFLLSPRVPALALSVYPSAWSGISPPPGPRDQNRVIAVGRLHEGWWRLPRRWRARFSSGRAPPSGGRSRHRHLPAAGHCQRRGFKQLAPNRSNQAGRPGRGSTRWHPTLCCSPRCCRELSL